MPVPLCPNSHPTMKSLKILSAVLTAALLAALTIGANPGDPGRPSNVSSKRWISIGTNAGFALNAEVGGPNTLAERSNVPVVAELYVKTTSGWKRARLDNPVYATPLNP